MFWKCNVVDIYVIKYGKRNIYDNFVKTQNVKCMPLINKPCLARPIIIDWNPESRYYSFLVSLDKLDGCSNNLNDLRDYLLKIRQKN